MSKKAVIIGAGPAGLTFAYELLEKTDISPVIFEATEDLGGISKTVEYKGNRIDIGGHRFFSKSDKIMQWWLNILPLQKISRNHPSPQPSPARGEGEIDPEKTDKVMLVRSRLSRIFFLRKFFDYPISLSTATFKNLGLIRVIKIGLSYIKSSIFSKKEKSLEDFFINRFGKELYLTFFKDYTEKVWGVPCSEIKPEWGAQRIKGLSIRKTILHAIKKFFSKNSGLSQKDEETSLIEQFMYPKLGPGCMWESVAQIIKSKGGEINLGQKIVGINSKDNKITSVLVQDTQTGKIIEHRADYYISSMPVRDLIAAMGNNVPSEVKEISDGLKYRDFITVGLLMKKLKTDMPDNWVYIQERDVKLGRLQIFNNWSPYLVKNPDNIWIGLEYFCNEGDELWNMPDFTEFAIAELAKIDIINKEDVLDSIVIRMPKAYPAYFGTYDRFDEIKKFVNTFENLFLVGRNGMHRYNNMDHSMLSAMLTVENIMNNVKSKDNIWDVNAEDEYHEEMEN
ncbi:MAG: NAD(P)/FAD-dependent oxidoreductase [Candidatus Gastranaerophilales bacterium]|nr:NAD(P)/FAD-dependent oxidoreductase [Candidatus Gastranaerophilales bacterium]